MTREEAIEQALNEDIELSREDYAKKKAEADKITEAHGAIGEAPLSEEERERRMRMNYYGISVNILMSLLSAVDDLSDRITTLNNNVVQLLGGTNVGNIDTGTGK